MTQRLAFLVACSSTPPAGSCTADTQCSGGRCLSGQCVENACVGVTCDAGTACAGGACMSTACAGVTCDGGVCVNGSCVETACVPVTCDAGATCQGGACVENACLSVSCDAGTLCSAGACVSACSVSCAAPCPSCANGRSCAGNLECDSRFCSSGVCTACSGTMNNCPNGGLCMNGVCRSGLEGPCASTLDCQTGLTCDQGTCRRGQGGTCANDNQCISSLRCENLICQRPRCMLQTIETQTVPGVVAGFAAMAYGLSPVGELLVTHGQWDNNYTNSNIRRFFVSPGVVTELDPKPPNPLIALPNNSPVPAGHSDAPGSAQANPTSRHFYWYPAGGPFDGRLAVDIQFTGFDNDVTVDFNGGFGGGGFAKCGDHFFFFGNRSGGQVMLHYRTPNPIGSGTTAQVLNDSNSDRRDSWPLQGIYDINCTPTALYVLGRDSLGVRIQKLDYNLVNVGSPLAVPGSLLNSQPHEWAMAVVDDTVQFPINRSGVVNQIVDGGVSTLSNIGSISTDYVNMSTPDVIVIYGGGTVRRIKRVMMNGSVPPLDLDCQWQ